MAGWMMQGKAEADIHGVGDTCRENENTQTQSIRIPNARQRKNTSSLASQIDSSFRLKDTHVPI